MGPMKPWTEARPGEQVAAEGKLAGIKPTRNVDGKLGLAIACWISSSRSLWHCFCIHSQYSEHLLGIGCSSESVLLHRMLLLQTVHFFLWVWQKAQLSHQLWRFTTFISLSGLVAVVLHEKRDG